MKQKPPLFLDIGTEAVKAGFLGKTAIEYYDKFGFFVSGDFEKEVFEKAVLKSAEGVQNSSRCVILGLPTDTLKAKVSCQFLERDNPNKIISQREEGKIREELFKKSRDGVGEAFFQECGISPQELCFSEELFTETSIEGYSVPRLAGYKGRRVGAVILSVFSLKNHLEKFQQIFKGLDLSVLKIVHPGQYLPKMFKDTRDGLFIDVGGQATQLFILKNGKPLEFLDFPAGGLDFSKELSQRFGLSEEKARDLKESYGRGEASEETRARIHEIFSETAESWFLSLKSKLQSFKDLIPSEVLLFGGASQLPEISAVLENLTKEKNLQILKNPQLINLKLISHAC